MITVVWTRPALSDLEQILTFTAERSPRGAATIANRVERSVLDIATFPRANRRDPSTGVYECVVKCMPLLLIYELISFPGGLERAEIVAVFHTSRDPSSKVRRREA